MSTEKDLEKDSKKISLRILKRGTFQEDLQFNWCWHLMLRERYHAHKKQPKFSMQGRFNKYSET